MNAESGWEKVLPFFAGCRISRSAPGRTSITASSVPRPLKRSTSCCIAEREQSGRRRVREFISEAQSYYRQGYAVEGEWQGKLAEEFGLTGEVRAADFALLAEGKHPRTQEQMVKHRGGQEYVDADGTTTKEVEHRAGWDAPFSAPKSVSLTALVGGDDQVREAHRAAVTAALTELERYTQARIGGNHQAETTGEFIAAKVRSINREAGREICPVSPFTAP